MSTYCAKAKKIARLKKEKRRVKFLANYALMDVAERRASREQMRRIRSEEYRARQLERGRTRMKIERLEMIRDAASRINNPLGEFDA